MPQWNAPPHDPIEKLEENLWTVEGDLPSGGPLRRRMSVVKLPDGRLALHNGVCLADPAMREIEAWGEPALLLVSNGYHRIDLQAYKERYPRLRVFAPAPHAARIARKVKLDGTFSDLPRDPALWVELLDGSKFGEGVFVVTSGGKTSLLFGDTVFNLPHQPGVGGLLLRLFGSSGGPRVTPLARLLAVSDRAALGAHLARLAAVPGLTHLVPTHGKVVSRDAAAVLRAVAAGA